MDLTILPEEFSDEARRTIVGSKIKAERGLLKRKKPVRSPAPQLFPKRSWEVIQCVMTIFDAVSGEIDQLTNAGWTSDRIESFAREFLRKQIIAARVYYSGDADFELPTMISSVTADIAPQFERVLHSTPEWRRYERRLTKSAKPSRAPKPASSAPKSDELARRNALLASYKAATGSPSNRQIYNARNSGIHKPEFYDWINGILAQTSQTCENFERFLREKKHPVPRKSTS